MAKLSTDDLLDAFKEMTLLELSEFVKQFEDTFDVKAAAPVAAVAAAPAGVRRGPGGGGEGRVRRHPRGRGRQEDPGHQGGPQPDQPGPQGGQGPGGLRAQAAPGAGQQGGRGQGQGGPGRGRRHCHGQVSRSGRPPWAGPANRAGPAHVHLRGAHGRPGREWCTPRLRPATEPGNISRAELLSLPRSTPTHTQGRMWCSSRHSDDQTTWRGLDVLPRTSHAAEQP